VKLVTCAPGSLILRRFCGAQWLAAPAADIRAMSVGGSRCIHCANVRRPLAPPSSCRRSPGSDTGHEALLRYPSFSARHRRRLALRHQHFNLTKQHNNLLRAKLLPRHLQAPLPAHSLTRSAPKKPCVSKSVGISSALRAERQLLRSFNPGVIYCHDSVTSSRYVEAKAGRCHADDSIQTSFKLRDRLRSMRQQTDCSRKVRASG
jgi:hypothetical protein